MKDKRELAYWGAGEYGRLCVEQHSDVKPDFFIDSNRGTISSCCGIPVKTPDEVQDWNNVFVVITTTAIAEIEKVLKAKNLIRNENYTDYKDFFTISKESLKEKAIKMEQFIEENAVYKGAILITAPVFNCRISNDMIRFFRQYGIKRNPQKCILLTKLPVINEKDAGKIMGYPVFDLAEFFYWNGTAKQGMDIDTDSINYKELLSKDELEWIHKLEEVSTHEDQALSCTVTTEIYWYFKNILLSIRPSKVLIWGFYTRQSYILSRLSKEMGIPCGFMEYGWIPGTVQFNKHWPGQQSYHIKESEINFETERKNIKISKIKKYITVSEIDTGKFRKTEMDEKSLHSIDRNRKTIFFVGMVDNYFDINPQSDFWRKYISSTFRSTAEGVLFTAKICKKNGWNFVFKPHPASANENKIEQIDKSIIFVRDAEIDRLIEISDVVVSFGSKVDFKVGLHEKPLIKIGYVGQHIIEFSYEAHNKEILEHQIKTALDMGMSTEQKRNFELNMMQLLKYHLWDDLTDRELRYGLSLDTDFFDAEVT